MNNLLIISLNEKYWFYYKFEKPHKLIKCSEVKNKSGVKGLIILGYTVHMGARWHKNLGGGHKRTKVKMRTG